MARAGRATRVSVELLKYDEACRAVAEAKTVDEAATLANKMDALRVYYRKAKNRDLEIDAAEIRIRAEQRLGEMLIEGKAKGWFGEGRPPENCNTDEQFPRVNLADLGIDRSLSARAQAVARLPREDFEGSLGRWREDVARAGARVTTNLLREREKAERRAAFTARTADGCDVDDLAKLVDSGRRFGAILVDPPWAFETWSAKGRDRSPGYRTDPLKAIAELPVAKLAAKDCVLFPWAIGSMLREALDLVDAWGFDLKTIGFAWMKQNASGDGLFMGQGYWTRQNIELCLLATRGAPMRLDAGVMQAILSPVQEHSRKPDEIHDRIERLVGGPYLELYARRPHKRWFTWGNEISRAAFEAEVARECAGVESRSPDGRLSTPCAGAEGEGSRDAAMRAPRSDAQDLPEAGERTHAPYAADRSPKWGIDVELRVAALYEDERLSMRAIGERLGIGRGEAKGLYRRFKEKRARVGGAV